MRCSIASGHTIRHNSLGRMRTGRLTTAYGYLSLFRSRSRPIISPVPSIWGLLVKTQNLSTKSCERSDKDSATSADVKKKAYLCPASVRLRMWRPYGKRNSHPGCSVGICRTFSSSALNRRDLLTRLSEKLIKANVFL